LHAGGVIRLHAQEITTIRKQKKTNDCLAKRDLTGQKATARNNGTNHLPIKIQKSEPNCLITLKIPSGGIPAAKEVPDEKNRRDH
jgi:hypothetical protein